MVRVENIAMPEPVGASHVERNFNILHHHFLEILPRIELHAKIYFRHLKCPGRRADAIAEVVAFAWLWFLRLAEQPAKDVTEFVSALATYAVRHVRSGRRLCGQERAREVLSPVAQHRHGFTVEQLDHSTQRSHERIYGEPYGQQTMDAFEERLRDNTQSPVPEQAAFRIDFPVWLSQLGPRNRAIAEDMTLDLGTGELADKHKISAGRVSQLRREFCKDWQRFHGDSKEASA
jgi:hypothetical protein